MMKIVIKDLSEEHELMSKYTLIICSRALTAEQMEQVSNLCYGAQVEPIEENDSNLIAYAHAQEYEYEDQGTCYRIFTEQPVSALGLLENKPMYIGHFDDKIERRCIELSALCGELKNALYYVDGLGDRVNIINGQFENILGDKSPLKCENAHVLEDDYLDALYTVESAINEIISECRVKSVI